MAHDVGDTVALQVLVTDDGVATDPDTLVLHISRPDGLTDTPDPLQVATGDYRVEYVVTLPGTYGVS